MKGLKVYFISTPLIGLIILSISALSFTLTFIVKGNINYSRLEKKIVIDAGHGGIDAGTNLNGILEKNINLSIAKRLARLLNRGHTKIIMIRSKDKLYQDDRNKDIVNRVRVVNRNNADILVSIHVNSYPNPKYSGGQVFYQKGSVEGKRLASYIQEELCQIQPNNHRQTKSSSYYILRKSKVPAVIVEVGFITNPDDRRRITTPKEQDKIAKAIAEGVINYFNNKLHLPPSKATINLCKLKSSDE